MKIFVALFFFVLAYISKEGIAQSSSSPKLSRYTANPDTTKKLSTKQELKKISQHNDLDSTKNIKGSSKTKYLPELKREIVYPAEKK